MSPVPVAILAQAFLYACLYVYMFHVKHSYSAKYTLYYVLVQVQVGVIPVRLCVYTSGCIIYYLQRVSRGTLLVRLCYAHALRLWLPSPVRLCLRIGLRTRLFFPVFHPPIIPLPFCPSFPPGWCRHLLLAGRL